METLALEFNLFVVVFVISMMLSMGLGLNASQITATLKKPLLSADVLIANLVLVPLAILANVGKRATSPMHPDFQNHRKTELDTLTGYIVNEAEKLHLDVPVMQRMYRALIQKETL